MYILCRTLSLTLHVHVRVAYCRCVSVDNALKLHCTMATVEAVPCYRRPQTVCRITQPCIRSIYSTTCQVTAWGHSTVMDRHVHDKIQWMCCSAGFRGFWRSHVSADSRAYPVHYITVIVESTKAISKRTCLCKRNTILILKATCKVWAVCLFLV